MNYNVRFQSGIETRQSGTGDLVSDTRKYAFREMKAKTHHHLVRNIKRVCKEKGYTGWRIYQPYEGLLLENDMKYLPQ